MFHKLRGSMKIVVIIVIVAMAGGGLWAAISYLFGGQQPGSTEAAAVVATVNGQVIHAYDLQQVFLNQLQQLESQQGMIPSRSYEAVRYQALDSIIGSVVLGQEITNRKLSASKAEIDAELQKIKDLFPSEDDYKTQLTYAGLTESILRSQIGEEIKFDKLTREVIGDLPVSEEEIRAAYEKVRTSHILIRPAGTSDDDWALAEGKAWETHALVNAENFADVAIEVSEDGSASQGGDIGFVGRGQTVEEYETTAFALEVGEISEPVRSSFGFHIITVTERQEAEGEAFEAARAEIEDSIRLQKGQGDLMAWYEGVRNEADVVVIDYQMNAFRHMQAEEFEDAAHYYKLAIEQRPGDGYLYASLGDAYYELGNMDEAIAQYKLATKNANDYMLLMGLGDIYKEREQVEEASAAYLEASALVPNDIWTQLALYQYLKEMGQDEDAKIVEDRISAFQEMQNEFLKQQAGLEEESEIAPEEVLEDALEELVAEEEASTSEN